MTLYEQWQKESRDISTNNFQISVGELINRYKDSRIKINPIYQRYYRWDNKQKSDFIESLLLGLPIPPIFMFRDTTNGFWEIIDGLQRLGTIFEFVGILSKDIQVKKELKKLEECSIISQLENKTWEDFKLEGLDFILTSQILNVIVLDYKQASRTKFEIFRRLNSSSTVLSPQEVRNARLAEIAPETYIVMEQQFKLVNFSFLSESQLSERKDLELFLEYILIKKIILKKYELSDSFNFSETLDEFVMNITKEDIEENASEFMRFITQYGVTHFKYHKDNKPNGNFINAYFEILVSYYFYNKMETIDPKVITRILSKKYIDWQKEINVVNPPALIRMKYAIIYAQGLLNG